MRCTHAEHMMRIICITPAFEQTHIVCHSRPAQQIQHYNAGMEDQEWPFRLSAQATTSVRRYEEGHHAWHHLLQQNGPPCAHHEGKQEHAHLLLAMSHIQLNQLMACCCGWQA